MNFDARIKQEVKSLASKSQEDAALDIGDKYREKIKKFETFNVSYFLGKSFFDNDGSQNYLIFQPIYNTFRMKSGNTETVIAWKCKTLSDESSKPPTTTGNSLALKLKWIDDLKIAAEFRGGLLETRQSKFY